MDHELIGIWKEWRLYLILGCNLFLNEVGPLGRWGQEKCAIKLNKKIDLANEDNCGPCGEYILEKLKITATKMNLKLNKNETSHWLMAEHKN